MHTALSERRTEKTRTLFKICSKRQARVLLAGKKEEEEKEGGEPLYFLRHLTATRGGQRERHRKSSIKTGSFPLFPPTRYKSNICLCDPSSSSSDTLRQHNSAPGEEGAYQIQTTPSLTRSEEEIVKEKVQHDGLVSYSERVNLIYIACEERANNIDLLCQNRRLV